MPSTPKLTTAREAFLVRLERVDGTGNYHNRARVKEGAPDYKWISGLSSGQAALFLTRTVADNTGRYAGATARRMAVDFIVRGYVNATGNRSQVEKLEHDTWRATATGGGLGDGIDVPRLESAEIDDDEFETGEGKITLSYVEMRFRLELSESI